MILYSSVRQIELGPFRVADLLIITLSLQAEQTAALQHQEQVLETLAAKLAGF